jgi:hypothetical protein
MRVMYCILMLFALVGCSRKLDVAEYPDVYEFTLENVRQEITIRADKTYSNKLYSKGVLVWSDVDEWEYEAPTKAGSEEALTFSRFRIGFEEYNRGDKRRGYAVFGPEKSVLGVKKLCFDPDLYRCFEAAPDSKRQKP